MTLSKFLALSRLEVLRDMNVTSVHKRAASWKSGLERILVSWIKVFSAWRRTFVLEWLSLYQ